MRQLAPAAHGQPTRRGLSGVARILFAPSTHITGPAERRRASLLSKVQFVHALQLAFTAVMIRGFETNPLHRAMIPAVLGLAALGVAFAYALSRTRHVGWSIWSHVFIAVGVPIAILLRTGRPELSPFPTIAFLLSPVLLASTVASVRATAVTGVVGIAAAWVAAAHFGPPPSWETDLRQATVFLAMHVLLVCVFHVHRDGVEADRANELRARNEDLEALRLTLEARVTERTAQLHDRNAGMRLVLDNVAQGLLTIERSGAMSSEHSAVVTRWFGPSAPGQAFYEYFGRHAPAFSQKAEMMWQQVLDDVLPIELTLAQMPQGFSSSGQHYRVSYQPIGTGRVERFLLVVSNVTSEVERDQMDREMADTTAMFQHMLADRPGFLVFVEEASVLVATVVEGAADLATTRRALHTLKGNALTLSLRRLAQICHDLESNLDASPTLGDEDRATLRRCWDRLAGDVDRLLGTRKEVVEVSLQQYGALEAAIQCGHPHEDLARLLREWRLEPVDLRFQHLAEQARRLATRLEKRVNVELSADGVLVEGSRFASLWTHFVHLVRNALDHGIESPDERRQLGKPAEGRLVLRARESASGVVIELEDDGRGIDWDRIRQKCATLGLSVEDDRALVEALFAEGMSTAQVVTDISGRGVGMGALRAAVFALGGSVAVHSQLGVGTTIRIGIPRSGAARGGRTSVRPAA